MKKISLFYLLITSCSLFAQAPVFEWVVQLRGLFDGAGQDIATDAFGNVYATGFFTDTVDFDPGPGVYELISADGQDIFVSKLNADGHLLWAVSFGFDNPNPFITVNDDGRGITTDTSGHVYICGRYRKTVDFDPGPDAFYLPNESLDDHAFVLKLDANGSFIWAKKFGDDSGARAEDIAVDNIGNVYTVGGFEFTVDFDPGDSTYNLISNGGSMFISKLDSAGNFVWAKRVGPTWNNPDISEDFYNESLALDSASNVYITGWFNGNNIDFDPGSEVFYISGTNDQFILKLNSDGEFNWATRTGNAVGYGVAVDPGGNVYTTGAFGGTVDFAPGPDVYNLTSLSTSGDAFISKLDTDGNLLWVKGLGGGIFATGYAIALDKNKDVYVTGRFNGVTDFDPSIGAYMLSGDRDIFIEKLNSNGFFIWAGAFKKTEVGIGQLNVLNIGYAISVDDSDNILTTGSFSLNTNFSLDSTNVFVLTPTGSWRDIFIHKMRQGCTAIPSISSSAGVSTLCPGQQVSLTAILPAGVTEASYLWSTGDTTSLITFTATNNQSYTVTATDANGCTATDSVMVSVYPLSEIVYQQATTCDPSQAGVIEYMLSDQNGCDSIVIVTTTLVLVPAMPEAPTNIIIEPNNPPFTLAVSAVLNATSYSWQVPSGVQIVSGADLNSVVLDWGSMSTSGQVCVTALNECGASPSACTQITVDMEIGVNELARKGYTIFPNPADEYITVLFEEERDFEVALLDVLGREVVESAAYSGRADMVTRYLPAGLYWLRVSVAGAVYWEQVEVGR